MRASPLLEMRGIVKHYGAVRANDGIDLDVSAGQIVGLLGENGSGKSTLMKVLFGMVAPDAGSIVFRGKELSGHLPREAIAAGIDMVHQHFMLVEAMTVAENIMIGWEKAGRWLRTAEIAEMIRETSAGYGLDLDPRAPVGMLSFGQRQRVEILKAILRGAELLVLDEPTSNLSPPEINGLITVMRRLRAEGKGIVFISHKLAEVTAVCDEAVVLRDGRVVGRAPIAQTTRADLARLMVGRDVVAPIVRTDCAASDPLLSVENLSVDGPDGQHLVSDVSFSVCGGEVLAIAGVDGNGQLELVEAIAGIRRPAGGTLRIRTTDVSRAGVAARIAHGLSFIPPDRSRTSLVSEMSIAENLALRDVRQPPYSRGVFLSPRGLQVAADRLIEGYAIRAPGGRTPVHQLSGGNQQKIVVAREMDRGPKVLVAFQAAWGLDPGATRFVLEQVLALRGAGAAVLYISTELEELLSIGDRIGVMFRGRLAGIMRREEVDLERLGLMMAGTSDDSATLAA